MSDPVKPEQETRGIEMNAIPYDRPEEEWDSYEEGTEELALPGRPRRQWFNKTSAAVFAVLLGAIGFYVGVRVEKSQVSSSSSASGAAGGAAAALRRRGGSWRCRDRCDGQRCRFADRHGRGRRGLPRAVRRRRRVCRRRRRRERDVRNRQQHQRRLSLHHRGLRQHGEGHAVERDQGHKERWRRQEARCVPATPSWSPARRTRTEPSPRPRSATPARASQPVAAVAAAVAVVVRAVPAGRPR